jgi:predicted dehydrogenase
MAEFRGVGAGPVGVGIVGCGTISRRYLENLAAYPDVRILACADLDVDRAASVAAQHRVPTSGNLDAVLGHPEIEVVVNLTIPAAHADVTSAAIAAGKHVYSEKPLALDPMTGARLLTEAATADVRIGSAPDTFLGAGLQTAYRLISQGAIGTPLSALTLTQSPGPEAWHQSPEFLFQAGGGPLLDMGPYYLTALAIALGPVARGAATARTAHVERVIGSGPRAGTTFPVTVPTHVNTLVEFASGPVAAGVFSFDSPLDRGGFIEITGTEATLAMPNPNAFAGPSRLRRAGDEDWTTVEMSGAESGRGVGVLEMARAIRSGRPHRADGAAALHIVEVMTALLQAAEQHAFVPVTSTLTVPEPLPEDWDPTARTLD